MGLHRAGFEVTGIDIRPQKRYPFRFIQGDALAPPVRLDDFDFIWASPPCQAYVNPGLNKARRHEAPRLVEVVREMLSSSGAPFAIENVPAAPLRRTLVLTGGMFGLRTYRKRAFEISFLCLGPEPERPWGPLTRNDAVTVCGHPGGRSKRNGFRGRFGLLADWKEAMGIDWAIAREIAQAVPPAYAEFIGRAAIEHLDYRGGRGAKAGRQGWGSVPPGRCVDLSSLSSHAT